MNGIREVDGRKEKYCNDCRGWKALDEFSKDSSRPSGLAPYCKRHSYDRRERSRQKRLAHYQAKNREWNHAHPDLLRKAGEDFRTRMKARRQARVEAMKAKWRPDLLQPKKELPTNDTEIEIGKDID